MRTRRRGLSVIELVIAMFLLSIAVVSVAYVFADAISDIFHSRIMTQGAFLAQSIMEISLLVEPLQPVADSTDEAQRVDFDPYLGFSYRVFVSLYPVDRSFYQIDVEVYNQHVSQGEQSIATCVALRKVTGKPPQQAGMSGLGTAYIENGGSIQSMLSKSLEREEYLGCSR